MTYNRYAQYPPEWDNEPDDYWDDLPPEPDEDDVQNDIERDAVFDLPDGMPADDLWHAQQAEDRDRFLHPPDPA